MNSDINFTPLSQARILPKLSPISGCPAPTVRRGRPKNSSNLHAKQPSGIAIRLKKAGVDWIEDLAAAIKSNNEPRINMWLKLLPFLVTVAKGPRMKKFKGRASKAAVLALEALEGE